MGFSARTEMLLGEESTAILASSSVALFGLGGVGGGALEALARSGIGEFHLIDGDVFSESNLNRQLLATVDSIGKSKVEVGRQRILSINPNAKVFTYPVFYLPEKDNGVDFSKFDFVIDAIDTIAAKIDIIRICHELNVPMVSCMGCGNRFDPSKLHVTDLFATTYDPLAKVMRKKCKDLGIKSLRVVASTEPPSKPLFNAEPSSLRRDTPGSTPFVPPVAGYLLAQEAVMRILKK